MLVTDEARDEIVQPSTSGKRTWVAPNVEIAEARDASAFGGPPGGVDYGIYS